MFCRRSCRQRDYEARRRADDLGLSDGELVVLRAHLGALQDRLYVLEAAVEDVDRDLAGVGASDTDAYRDAVAWLLEAARPLVAAGKALST